MNKAKAWHHFVYAAVFGCNELLGLGYAAFEIMGLRLPTPCLLLPSLLNNDT